MLIVHGYDKIPPAARGAVLAIGNFDGVHRGHQALLQATKAKAREVSAPAGVLLFEPHPREFFQPDKPHFRLTPLALKLDLLAGLGLDVGVVLAFDRALAGLLAEEFIDRVLVRALAVRHVVVGDDFHFGKGRGGNPQVLQRAAAPGGFGVTVIPPVGDGGEVFSSSVIRTRLAQGDVEGAARMLGWWWRVSGRVVGGARRGTGLGFPTANITLAPGVALGHGIYAVRVHTEGECHAAAAYLGTRPTFDDGAPVLEVFLLDFQGDLYGREIAVEFIAFIRPDRRFDSAEALQEQMAKDCAEARARLAAAPAGRAWRPLPHAAG